LAEMPSALSPMPKDSPSATTPRITGNRYTRRRFIIERSGNRLTSISPTAPAGASSGAGLRTATAHVETPRIITPSSTAWPPSGASREAVSRASLTASAPTGELLLLCSRAGSARPAALRDPTLEALDAATGIHELLTSGVERV